jgi:hypothetical protein
MQELKAAQCEANCRAWFDYYGWPQPLLISAEDDRCYFEQKSEVDFHMREEIPRFSAEISQRKDTLEMDFDYYNPDYGALYAFLHFWLEIFPNHMFARKTNPFTIMNGLRKRGIDVKDVRVI